MMLRRFKSFLQTSQYLPNITKAYTTHSNVRVRFAPSPTGQLHLGGLRTALYNYLYARSHNGKLIMRIEDTDQNRLVLGSAAKIEDMLNWAGIEFDEGPRQGGEYGPYLQSERKWIYWEQIQQLLQNGTAYHCFCSPKRLELMRKEAIQRGETPRYDNRCRCLKQREVDDYLRAGTPYTIRLRLESYTDPWHDMVYGPIICDIASYEGDPILMKTDRYPTYHFANVVDDHMMRISHVLRGVEWQVSTTKHMLIYEAFGWTPPHYAHLPLLLNKDGKKLSKRHDDGHLEFYKDKGFLPEALVSLLTGMGSGFKVRNSSELTMEELIKEFDIHLLNTNSTTVDLSKARAYNQYHLRRMLESPLRQNMINNVRHMVQEKFYKRSPYPEEILTDKYIGKVLDFALERLELLSELVQGDFDFLWVIPSNVKIDNLVEMHSDLLKNLKTVSKELEQYPEDSWTTEELSSSLRRLANKEGFKIGPFMLQIRGVLSGLEQGPPVAELLSLLGKRQSLKRINRVIYKLEHT